MNDKQLTNNPTFANRQIAHALQNDISSSAKHLRYGEIFSDIIITNVVLIQTVK